MLAIAISASSNDTTTRIAAILLANVGGLVGELIEFRESWDVSGIGRGGTGVLKVDGKEVARGPGRLCSFAFR